MIKRFKYFFWNLFEKIGLDIYKFDYKNSVQRYLQFIIRNRNIELIYDIGANEGQYGMMLINIGYKNQIYSFEPLKNEWNSLKKISLKYSNWHVEPRTALTNNDKSEIDFYYTSNSQSSSAVKPLKNNFFNIEKKVKVPSKNINSIFKKNSKNSILKLDIQGYELELIKGINFDTHRPKIIQVELSVNSIYETGNTFFETVNFLKSRSYKLIGLFQGFSDHDGKIIEIECFFENFK